MSVGRIGWKRRKKARIQHITGKPGLRKALEKMRLYKLPKR